MISASSIGTVIKDLIVFNHNPFDAVEHLPNFSLRSLIKTPTAVFMR